MLTTLTFLTGLFMLSSASGCAPMSEESPNRTTPDTVSESPPPPDTMPETVAEDDIEDAADDPVTVLLDRLERSADELQGFKAGIRYTKVSSLLGRSETRRGELIYQLDADGGGKRFAILFDQLQVGRRLENRKQHFIFDGRWLVEIDDERKQFIKREIVGPGRELDPLKLGEGPFPLPVGQPRAEVVARFDVELVTPPVEGPLSKLGDVEGLALVPRPGTPEAEEFRRVEIFYDRKTMLPVGIDALEVNDDRKIVVLTDAERNPELGDDDRSAALDVDEPDPAEWTVDVRPWQG